MENQSVAKRDKYLAYRILKLCQTYSSPYPDDPLRTKKIYYARFDKLGIEFSDILDIENGMKILDYHFRMLGDLGCFLNYTSHFSLMIYELSWIGHNLLESLEAREGYSLPDPE